jgi:hypothetical protein
LTQSRDCLDSDTTTESHDHLHRIAPTYNLLSTAGHFSEISHPFIASVPGAGRSRPRSYCKISTYTSEAGGPPIHSNIMSSTRTLAVLAVAQMVSAQAAPAQSGTAATAAQTAAALQAKADMWNQDFSNYMFIILGSLIVALLVWRVGSESVKYVRTLASLSNDTQRYFTVPSEKFSSFKKHVLYAPIFRKRHNREFQLSSAVNVGTLPTRLQLLFLVSYFGTNIAFCVVSINWDQPLATASKELRNRTGILAVVNMVIHSSMSSIRLSRGKRLICIRFPYS